VEICEVLLDLLIRPLPLLPNRRSLGDATDLRDLPFDEWRVFARSEGSGLAFAVHVDGRKCLISTAGQKKI